MGDPQNGWIFQVDFMEHMEKATKPTWMITRGSPILGHLHITMYNWDVPSGICSEFSESHQSEEVKSRGYRNAQQLCF